MANPKADRDKVVYISAITSDIGIALAKRYSRDGYTIAGTYRSTELLREVEVLPNCHLAYCDLRDPGSIAESVAHFRAGRLKWETLISCAAIPQPLTSFFRADFEQWNMAIHVNAVEQLRVLHALYDLRDTGRTCNVVFFAGPGTNNAVKNFSAAVVSKIMLIKMCELLDLENEDLNVFIVGPGWTKTKTHLSILSDPDVSREKYEETVEFMRSKQGTNMDEIYDCICWLSTQGKPVAGGRNFSVVHDCWGGSDLAGILRSDSNMYKLRRFHNEWKDRQASRT